MDSVLMQEMLRDMLLARAFEERAAEEYAQGNIAGFLYLYPGEEAVSVGVIRATEPADYIVSTYREHVHALVRGIPAGAVMAELFGKKGGVFWRHGRIHAPIRSRAPFHGGVCHCGRDLSCGYGHCLCHCHA